jgi:hypothetical protein
MPASKAPTAAGDLAAAELSKLYIDTGIDLSQMPAIMTPDELAPVLGLTVGALANDRFRRVGIPYVKHGKRVRYLRADVARYLVANRRTYPAGA